MKQITVETLINAPIEKVWEYWTNPEHIIKWCHASDDWHAPSATNNLKIGGTFTTRMEAKDGSFGFDFGGTYTDIKEYAKIAYDMGDTRKVAIEFIPEENSTKIIESFDPENENPIEMQKSGWQSILDNFKKYVETN